MNNEIMNKDFTIVRPRWIDLKLQHHLGCYSDRLMWWCNTFPPNFGDWIGPEIFYKMRGVWPKLAPLYRRPNNAPVHFSAGSILSACRIADVAIVWGTGIMTGNVTFAAPREIRAVRGPLTAARCRELGYKCPDILGDPGIVLSKYFPKTSDFKFQLGVIPHFVDQEIAYQIFSYSEEVKIIDVTKTVAQVISDIQSCEFLISSSLHGIILSHTFERPCAWVKFGDTLAGDGTKFHDYLGSAGLFNQPDAETVTRCTSILDMKRLAQRSPLPDLSLLSDKLFEACPF